jgi:ABC-type branched-subunit amino acid transport system substrate-binding protein
VALGIGWVILLAACPRRFDPRAAQLPESSDPEARAAFAGAQAALEQGRDGEARQAFERFTVRFTADPLALPAAVLQGELAYRQGDYAAARATLASVAGVAPAPGVADASKDDPVGQALSAAPSAAGGAASTAGSAGGASSGSAIEDPWRQRARVTLGLACYRLGELTLARQLLDPFKQQLADGEQRGDVLASSAEAAAQQRDFTAALVDYAAYWPMARPAERLWARKRACDVAALVATGRLETTFEEVSRLAPRSLAVACVGERLSAHLSQQREAGRNRARAEEVAEATASAWQALGGREGGDPLVRPLAEGGDPRLVGALVPLSGRTQLVGEAMLRGLLLATGVFGAAESATKVLVRDPRGEPSRAAAAVDELARAGVIAIIGPPDKSLAGAAAARAEALGVPFISLVERDVLGAGNYLFSVVYPMGARAESLVAAAAQRSHGRPAAAGRSAALPAAPAGWRVAVVARDDAYGQRMAKSFVAAAQARGGTVVATLSYPTGTANFAKLLDPLVAARPDAIFVADDIGTVRLVGPYLARLGLWSTPAGGRAPSRGHAVTLAATADKLAPGQLLANDVRYLDGALLEPRFFADGDDPAIGSFATHFRDAYGKEPVYVVEALAFDAAAAVRAAVEAASFRAVTTRSELWRALGARTQASGAADTVAFAPDGARAGAPRLYVIEANGVDTRFVRAVPR